eukprot:2789306-Prymnesium_polylepis.1
MGSHALPGHSRAPQDSCAHKGVKKSPAASILSALTAARGGVRSGAPPSPGPPPPPCPEGSRSRSRRRCRAPRAQ